MTENKMPLIHWYKKALHDEDINICTSIELSNIDINNLFTGYNALEFIRNYFGYSHINYTLKNPTHKFDSILNHITEFRAQHTVSSFLLGVIVKKELSLDTRNWIRLYDSKSSGASFGFFWSDLFDT